MTDQTEAPELIWAVSGYGCWQDEPPASGLRTGQWTEYTRKDISEAWVNAALTVSPNIDLDIEAHARAALAELKGSADDL